MRARTGRSAHAAARAGGPFRNRRCGAYRPVTLRARRAAGSPDAVACTGTERRTHDISSAMARKRHRHRGRRVDRARHRFHRRIGRLDERGRRRPVPGAHQPVHQAASAGAQPAGERAHAGHLRPCGERAHARAGQLAFEQYPGHGHLLRRLRVGLLRRDHRFDRRRDRERPHRRQGLAAPATLACAPGRAGRPVARQTRRIERARRAHGARNARGSRRARPHRRLPSSQAPAFPTPHAKRGPSEEGPLFWCRAPSGSARYAFARGAACV